MVGHVVCKRQALPQMAIEMWSLTGLAKDISSGQCRPAAEDTGVGSNGCDHAADI
jgi:hypothetical protein